MRIVCLTMVMLTSVVAMAGLHVGDYSNFQDLTFRKHHKVDATEVKKVFDEERSAYAYYVVQKKNNSTSDILARELTIEREVANKIVETSWSVVMLPKTMSGVSVLSAAVTMAIDSVSSNSREGNRIVAASSNFSYRGTDRAATQDALIKAAVDVISNKRGAVAVQWKVPVGYVVWQCTAVERNGAVVFMTNITVSDRYIKLDCFDN